MKLVVINELNKNSLRNQLKTITPTDNGFAGFKNLDFLFNYVNWAVFSDSEDITDVKIGFDTKSIDKLFEKPLEKLENTCKLNKELEIYVFPTASIFVLENMDGISGYSPYKNVIHLYLHNKVEIQEDDLINTVAHEYNHLMRYEYFYNDYSFFEAVVSEGLAENFREHIFGGKPANWSVALKVSEAKEMFKRLVKTFETKKYTSEDYNNIFFGNDGYKMWTGYSIGYYLVKDFLEKQKEVIWSEIVKIPVEDIVKNSGW